MEKNYNKRFDKWDILKALVNLLYFLIISRDDVFNLQNLGKMVLYV